MRRFTISKDSFILMRAINRKRRCVLYLVCWRDLTIGRLLHKNELGIQCLWTNWRQQSFVWSGNITRSIEATVVLKLQHSQRLLQVSNSVSNTLSSFYACPWTGHPKLTMNKVDSVSIDIVVVGDPFLIWDGVTICDVLRSFLSKEQSTLHPGDSVLSMSMLRPLKLPLSNYQYIPSQKNVKRSELLERLESKKLSFNCCYTQQSQVYRLNTHRIQSSANHFTHP